MYRYIPTYIYKCTQVCAGTHVCTKAYCPIQMNTGVCEHLPVCAGAYRFVQGVPACRCIQVFALVYSTGLGPVQLPWVETRMEGWVS